MSVIQTTIVYKSLPDFCLISIYIILYTGVYIYISFLYITYCQCAHDLNCNMEV